MSVSADATATNQANKYAVWDYWNRLSAATPETVAAVVRAVVHPQIVWHGAQPLNRLGDAEALVAGFWQPLLRAFPGLRRGCDVFLGGRFTTGDWVCGTGYFSGPFAREWLGIPPTGETAYLRYGEFARLEAGRIVETYLLLDLIDLMRQAGIRVLPPSPGSEERAPGPHDGGILLDPQDAVASRASLALVEAMIADLGEYDLDNPGTLNHTQSWTADMQWYGPIGIGTARGLAEYFPVHQRPFLTAFPDRRGGNHVARISEGLFVASAGWPSITRATHLGPWLGQPPTGRNVTMRVMDFWRREGDLLAQNWVFIDLVDVFLQFGVDLFARMRERVPHAVSP